MASTDQETMVQLIEKETRDPESERMVISRSRCLRTQITTQIGNRIAIEHRGTPRLDPKTGTVLLQYYRPRKKPEPDSQLDTDEDQNPFE